MASKVKPISDTTEQALKMAASALAVHAPSLTRESKAYEAFFAFEAALGLRAGGAAVTALDHKGAQTKTFIIRGGPGLIPPNIATGDQPSHFGITWNGSGLELHISLVHVSLHSQNSHELDVSIVSHSQAQELRTNGQHLPYFGARAIGAELKAYDSAAWLNKNIPRALLGLVLDLDPGAVAPSVEFKLPSGKTLLGGTFGAPQYFLLTTAQLRPPSQSLLNTYGIKSAGGLSAGSPIATAMVGELVAAVQARLGKI